MYISSIFFRPGEVPKSLKIYDPSGLSGIFHRYLHGDPQYIESKLSHFTYVVRADVPKKTENLSLVEPGVRLYGPALVLGTKYVGLEEDDIDFFYELLQNELIEVF